jgi:hypothetical protein
MDLNTATHRFDNQAKTNFIIAPQNESKSPLFNIDSAVLPLCSAIPKINPVKINQSIKKSNNKKIDNS